MKTLCGPAVRGEGGIAGEGKLVGVPKFPPWDKCAMPSSVRLDVQCFLWPVYYCIAPNFHGTIIS